jgi:aminoglycoside phosphotransferase (APT) family kinase protein
MSETTEVDSSETDDSSASADAELGTLVNLERLGSWMDAQELPGQGESIRTHLISGGSSNAIIDIQRGSFHCVLRRPPDPIPEGRNRAMLREYRVLKALNGTDVPHPDAYAACEDESVLDGAAFYLMSVVDGWSPMSMGDEWPEPFGSDLVARHGLGIQLVDGIARLARVDWKAAGLEGFGKPEGFLDRQVDRWLNHLSGFQFREIPGLDESATWLRDHIPAQWEPGIIHGDYQFANVMFSHGAPARLAAIIDWEMSTVGDPLLDLGWVMNAWSDPGEKESNYVPMKGMPLRSEMLEHYAKVSGRSVDEIDYYVILARFKLAIVLEGGYARAVKGETDNPKVMGYGPEVINNMRFAAELAATTTLGR